MPTIIKLSDCIDYLVLRRFPNVGMLRIFPSLSNPQPMPDTRQLKADVEAYKAELFALPFEELLARNEAEKRKEGEEIRQRLDREEQERFFNQPHARADFDYWSKAAHWTLDEAIALSFGRAPEFVRWDALRSLITLGSPFVVQYSRRRELALRAKAWEQLFDPVLPGIFLAWAKRTDIDVPPELIAAVEKRGVQVADWKSMYEKTAAALKQAEAALDHAEEVHAGQIGDWRKLCEKARDSLADEHAGWLEVVDGKNRTITELQDRVATLERAGSENALGGKARESLLKLVIGMACGGYGYDPKSSRNKQLPEISGDLSRRGVALDDDTIRKWLREAAEVLPGE